MSFDKNRFIGFSLAEVALVLMWEPLIDWFNSELPSTSIGTGLGLFFWIVMGITFLYLGTQILITLLGDF
jgi:hypothetical protein